MITPTTAKKPWPLIAWRTCRPICVRLCAPYRADSSACRWKAFDKRMPDTLRLSCVIAFSSARDSWVWAAIRARTCPTRRCTSARTGVMNTARIVRRQSISTIAISDAITVTELPSTLEIVLVSTSETAPTSFCSRDWMAPVRVRVKNPSSIACRWSNSRIRRSPVTRLPTVDVNHVCATPRPADSRNSPIIAATSRTSSATSTGPPSVGNSASSNTRCTISGGITATPAPTMTRAAVTARRPRYGEKRPATRRPRWGMRGAAAFATRCAAASAPRNATGRPWGPPGMLIGSA